MSKRSQRESGSLKSIFATPKATKPALAGLEDYTMQPSRKQDGFDSAVESGDDSDSGSDSDFDVSQLEVDDTPALE